jgi:hypothetical protein
MGGVTGNLRGPRAAELLRLHRESRAQRPPGCRVCGATACARAACFRAILAAEEALAFTRRLAQHASAAARDAGPRDAGTRRNGHHQ